MKSVTMRDVALKAHAASSTVSRYINKSGYVDSETAKNISEAIKELNYQPPTKNNHSSYKKILYCLQLQIYAILFIHHYASIFKACYMKKDTQ